MQAQLEIEEAKPKNKKKDPNLRDDELYNVGIVAQLYSAIDGGGSIQAEMKERNEKAHPERVCLLVDP